MQHITKLVMSGNPTPLGENSPSDSLPLEFGRLPSESLTSSPALVKQKQCRGACELKIKRSARESESAQSKTNLAIEWVDQQTNKKFLPTHHAQKFYQPSTTLLWMWEKEQAHVTGNGNNVAGYSSLILLVTVGQFGGSTVSLD